MEPKLNVGDDGFLSESGMVENPEKGDAPAPGDFEPPKVEEPEFKNAGIERGNARYGFRKGSV